MEHRQTRKNNFYQPNSKSFDKIMKGDRLMSSGQKNYETAAFREDNFGEADMSLGLADNDKSLAVEKQKNNKRQSSSDVDQLWGNREILRASELEEHENYNSNYDDHINRNNNNRNWS